MAFRWRDEESRPLLRPVSPINIHDPSITAFSNSVISQSLKSITPVQQTPVDYHQADIDFDNLADEMTQTPGVRQQKAQSHFLWTADMYLEASKFNSFDISSAELRLVMHSGRFWINFFDPSPREMVKIAQAFSLHPLTAEDIQTPDTREKCEVFTNYYFVVIRSFEQDSFKASYLQPIPVFIVIFKECVISFQFTPTNHPAQVLNRITQVQQYGNEISTDWINYALIDDIIDAFIPVLKSCEYQVDHIDDLVLVYQSEQFDMLKRIGTSRKQLNLLMRNMTTKESLIKMVANRCSDQAETRLYLEDIRDHVITMAMNLAHYEQTLTTSRSNYLAQISIELTQASNRTSNVVVKMTALAGILVPLNVVTGLWGMNVRVPGEHGTDLEWFMGIVMTMILVSILNLMLLRYNNLL